MLIIICTLFGKTCKLSIQVSWAKQVAQDTCAWKWKGANTNSSLSINSGVEKRTLHCEGKYVKIAEGIAI